MKNCVIFFDNKCLVTYILILLIILLLYGIREKYSFYKKHIELFQNDWETIVDGIVYINLDTRPDRKKQLLQTLKKNNIQDSLIHRIPAVYERNCGHLGCTKSHIKALEYAEKQNWNTFLVLEDDFIFTDSPDTVLQKLKRVKYNYNWDCIMLASHHINSIKLDKPYIEKVISASTTSGYIINRSYLPTLKRNYIEGRDLLQADVDIYIKENPNGKIFETVHALDVHWNNIQKNDNWYLIQIGKQSGSKSSIMEAIQ